MIIGNTERIETGGSIQKERIYKKDVYFINSSEEKRILSQKEFLREPANFLAFYKKRKKVDTFHYIYEGKSSSYHQDKNCPNIISKFTNFEVPKEIQESGRAEVERFRLWFKENYNFLIEKPDLFAAKLQIAFGLTTLPRIIEYDNSGITEIENLNLNELEQRIDAVLSAAGKFFIDNPDKQTIIRRFQKRTFLAKRQEPILDPNNEDDKKINLTDSELKSFLNEYDMKFKKPFKDLLLQYYMVKYNPELQFEGTLLEQLGFKPCSICVNAR